jgi:cobalt-zinc-cadmium resistance protein CzcA
MLDKIIHFSIHNKLIIGILTLALVLWGVYSVRQLPIDAVPDITNNQVQIITSSPSLAAQEIERLVTFPVEIAMATIPHLVEIRSISRFGLSVVTVVFKDEADIYWARQQVAERLQQAKAQIPAGVGNPELAPLSTGLSEIYQYTIFAKKGYEKKYDATELRTIQDWVVRRQLLGTEGVADVSSMGGYLKQYEIAVNPDKLRALNVTIADIFTALEKNNQNTGGAYIDKQPNAYFIRSEGLITNTTDIANVVIRHNANGTPILVRDVATVQFGHAVRYGAMVRNDEGEVVGGIVLMLKGENSSKVIANVKEKIAQIRKTLPEGVEIEAFLDRTKLVNNAINTVTKNLAEGALIVIFVLVLLLGNFRAGLVVASVIPLAMLFAIALMNVFGVSGNLMSLGAIDFGLIVDGAVIIVEATLHHLTTRIGGLHFDSSHGKGTNGEVILTQSQMDEEVYQSAVKIRSSAAFGEIIILIVYLPILSLSGIEGKMFKPMAQTVAFAILGAFILSLTYVPMVSALLLSKKVSHKKNIADRIIAFFNRLYNPVIRLALRQKLAVILTTVSFFVGSVALFATMGGEFIPSLDEGDFAVEVRLGTGSSLAETVEASLKAGKILKEKFPEVTETIGKIGSAEIPTDPMPLEACDLMILLKPKDQWVTADNREELAEKMAEELENMAGIEFGFQQPIQLRFNELMTGVRQDVAIKIYGEDLDILAAQAAKISKMISPIEGVKDVYVEKVGGLPQIVVAFHRERLAQYGISIADANTVLNTAFAGMTAGWVYEGEKRFDMVIRLEKDSRQNIEDVRNLFITNDKGEQIPITQIADIDFKVQTNQIQRENTKRRITVAFNVRGRDVESIVLEIQSKLDQQLKLPTGYSLTYGGQFQNLQEAKDRLSVAVPIALGLIFVLLYFTFGSIQQSILIFTAIPLSAIGGIIALWLRDMPFSISAGVGFIALFGVAVLNGIVLIAEFNYLKNKGVTDINERVLEGTHTRLRPVLMTALVASLGFLPMALSTGSGAEVQKPLATVVIGGLVSATLLTLVVLPCLYIYFEKYFKKSKS